MKLPQLCVVFCLLIVGCSGGNNLVGTWEAEGVGPNGIKGTIITFNANNTYSAESDSSAGRLTMSGDYTLEGAQLTMTLRKIDGLSDKLQKASDKRLAENPSPEPTTLEWKSDTELFIVASTGRSKLTKMR